MKAKFALILFKLIGKLSIKSAQRIAFAVGIIVFFLPLRENKISQITIKQIFRKKNKKYQKQLVKQSLIETTKSFFETIPIWNLNKIQLDNILNVYGKNHIENIKGTGIIFITLHIASWEIVNLWLSSHYPLSTSYQPLSIPEMENTIQAARSKFHAKMLAAGIKGVMALKRTLDHKGKILIATDQDPGSTGSVISEFFGFPARTSTLVPKLHQKTNAQILFIYTVRRQNGFDLHITKPTEKIYDDNLEIATLAMNNDLEKIILQNPSQYSWSYKRYKYQAEKHKFYQKC